MTMLHSVRVRRRILPILLLLFILAGSAFFLLKNVLTTVPGALVSLAEKNPEAAGFVSRYGLLSRRRCDAGAIDLTADVAGGGVPHLLQWDDRWGCAPYGSSLLAVSGCGPTSLSMVALALTGSDTPNPIAVADYSASQGWYCPGAGTSWELMRAGAEHFGLDWEELPLSESSMRQALNGGRLLILSMLPGDFTDSGHFIVVSGCSEEGFSVLDPNSSARSRCWSYETLCGQIANIWAYSAKG